MSSEKKYEGNDQSFSYMDDSSFGEANTPRMQRSRRTDASRKRSKAPSSFNGMHRRRRRKMAW